MVMTKPRSAQNGREAQAVWAPGREGSSQSLGWRRLESDNSFANGTPQALWTQFIPGQVLSANFSDLLYLDQELNQ